MISAGGWLSSVRRIEGASFFFFFFVLYFFFNPVYSATNPNYTACAPQTCDGITVQYPFSLSSQSGSGCGYPGLSLVCLDNNHSLLLQTPSLNFTVTGIDYSARTIDVAIDPNYMVGTPNCRYPRKNIALQDIKGATDPLPFVFTNGAPTQVTFFYNCTTPPSSGGPGGYVDGGGYDFTDKVVPSCSAAVWRSYAFFGSDSPGTVSMSCQSSVMFPVSASSTANNLASSLNDGFSMKWTLDAAVSNCRDCATSGGYCGSDSTTGSFVCFCQGHTHQATCNHSGLLMIGFYNLHFHARDKIVVMALCCITIYYYSLHEQKELPFDVPRINRPIYEILAGVEESACANLSAILSGGFFLHWRFDCFKKVMPLLVPAKMDQ